MIPLIPLLLYTNLVINNTCFQNVSGMSSFLGCTNNGLVTSAPFPISNYPLGIGMMFVVFIIITAVGSFRTDITLAAAFASMVCVGLGLLLATPQLAIVGPNIVYLFAGLTLFFIFMGLMRNTNKPYR